MAKIGQLITTRRVLNSKIKLRERYNGDKDNFHWIILDGSGYIEIYAYKDKGTQLDEEKNFSIASSVHIKEDDFDAKARIKEIFERLGFEYGYGKQFTID